MGTDMAGFALKCTERLGQRQLLIFGSAQDEGIQLQPLVDALRDLVLQQPVLQADGTPVQVRAPGMKKTQRGYVWAYVSSPFADLHAVVYDFSPSHGGVTHSKKPPKFPGRYILKSCDVEMICVAAPDYASRAAKIGKAQSMRLRDASHGETHPRSNGHRSRARRLRLATSTSDEP